MKRRSWLWFIASAILAIMAGAVAILALRLGAGGGGNQIQEPKQPVVVASRPIAARSVITVQDVAVEERAEVPSGAVLQVQEVLGRAALRDIALGEVITTFNVDIRPTIGFTDSFTVLLEDKIAVALPADDILSQWGAVLPGDHVDVLFTIDVILESPMTFEEVVTAEEGEIYQRLERDQSLDIVSALTLQNLEVLQIIEEPQAEIEGQPVQQEGEVPQPPRRALVLKIDPQDAVVLKYLRDSVGTIDVALRSPTNQALFDVDPVNINYLALRYGILLPQPLE